MRAVLLGLVLTAAPAAPVPAQDPLVKQLEGWTVKVKRELLEQEPETAAQALRLLEVKLHEITRAVPAPALARLREVPIWLGRRDEHGRFPCACYHPSRRWLEEHGYDPAKAGSVDILNAANFLEWTRDQPWMVLHELAHAYHHQVLGHDHPGIAGAFQQAQEAGLYEEVLRRGGRRERAYAMNNDQEYFAELSEAFFGTNDFYPFVRTELQEHDPAGFEAVRRAWEEGAGQSAAWTTWQEAVYRSGTGGYHTFRIPALVVTGRGTLLAFAEGRRTGRGDSGDIDLVLRRSTDRGRSWGPLLPVWDDGPNTCGNPCPVVDRDTGVVWLLMTRNLGHDHEREIIDGTSKGTRTVWVCSSADDGLTWSEPREITGSVKKEDWTWYATGPGNGIQLRDGRLLAPCDHIEAGTRRYFSHVIHSDDHGLTWSLGGSAGPQTNECAVVERADGSLLLNMRNYDRAKRARALSESRDRGAAWSEVRRETALPEPICQASMVRHSWPDGDRPGWVLFSNPASSESRQWMTVRASPDDGRSWPAFSLLHEGPSAYSSLAVAPDRTIYCLYERGDQHPYETITLARFDLAWILERPKEAALPEGFPH